MNSKVFAELWDWSSFLDLVDQMADLFPSDCTLSLNNILDIRWCTIQILSVVLRISDRSTRSFGMREDEAFACFLRLVQSFGFGCKILLSCSIEL